MDFTKSKYLLPIFLVWCSGTPIIPAQGIESLYEVEAFRDEFNTDGGPDPSKWKISDSLNSYYKELHYHSPKDSFIRNGSLVLRATNHPHGGANYTAGRLITQGNFDFNLGYVEIRAKLPPGKPFWSGLTLTDYRCRAKGCEDPNTFVVVMNAQAGQPSRDDVGVSLPTADGLGKLDQIPHNTSKDLSMDFHIYGLVWNQDSLVWYLDGREIRHVKGKNATALSSAKLQLDFGIVVDGMEEDLKDMQDGFPAEFLIDYILVKQKNSTA